MHTGALSQPLACRETIHVPYAARAVTLRADKDVTSAIFIEPTKPSLRRETGVQVAARQSARMR